jgi:hypothetical protein
MVPAPSLSGRTELICIYCEKAGPTEIVETKKWADTVQHQPASH